MIPHELFHVVPMPTFDPDRILADYHKIIAKYPIAKPENQLSLTHRPGADNPVYDGLGRAVAPETDYSEFVDEFKDTIFYDVYNALPYTVGRCRFMWVGPRHCYSYHRDFEPRLHLPVYTHEGCFFLFEKNEHECYRAQMGAGGQVYFVDTRVRHTFLNTGGNASRVHLVMTITGQKSC